MKGNSHNPHTHRIAPPHHEASNALPRRHETDTEGEAMAPTPKLPAPRHE